MGTLDESENGPKKEETNSFDEDTKVSISHNINTFIECFNSR